MFVATQYRHFILTSLTQNLSKLVYGSSAGQRQARHEFQKSFYLTRSESRTQTGTATSILKSVSGVVEGWLLYRWVWRNLTEKLLCSTEKEEYDKKHI
jgi:hypothetical protein